MTLALRRVVRVGAALTLAATMAPVGCSSNAPDASPCDAGGGGGFNTANPSVSSGSSVRWVQLPGAATDVAAGGFGELFVGHNSGVYKWQNGGWSPFPGAAPALDVGRTDTSLFGVSVGNTIYRYNGTGWDQLPGLAFDVGVGADESVWVVGTDYNTYRWTGADWEKHDAVASRIDVDPDGLPWVVTPSSTIYHMNAGAVWELKPGSALDVGVGATGDVFIAGTDGQAYRWQGDNWIPYTGGGITRVTADSNGAMNVTTNYAGIFKETAAPLGPTPLGCFADSGNRDLAVGLPGTTYTVETCTAGCGAAGYKYAGLQWYGYCFCGNTYGAYGASANCTTPCSANAGETCGGGWANSVYQVNLHQLTGFVLNGQQVGCNATESLPGSYDVACSPGNLSLNGLKGIIRSTSDFSLGGTVGNVAGQLGALGPIVDFANSNIVTGLDSAVVRIDGPAQGTRLTVNAQVGLGSAFDGLSQSIQDLSGVSLAALRPQIRLRYDQDHVRADAVIYQGNATYTVPEIGTGVTLKSVRLDYDSTKGSSSLTVQADTNLRPTANDVWVPTKLKLVRDLAGGVETITGSAHLSGWNKPFGFVPVNVVDADLLAGFTNRKLSAYRIQINQATATSYGGTYTLAGDYAVDRQNQLFAFQLTADRVPLLLMMQMLVGADPTLQSTFQALKLDQTMIHSLNGQPALFSLSPTGGTILGRTYEKKSRIYGALDVVLGTATVPAQFDLTGVVSGTNGNFTVGDFSAKVSLDLAAFTNMLRSQSTAAADILNALSVKSVAINVSRTGGVWAGGAQATLHLCGTDQTLAFDTNNVPRLVTDGVAFIGNTVQACINNATCPAGYEKGGGLCYPACAPGYASDGATMCYQSCPHGGSSSPGFCNYSCGNFGLGGAPPSCLPPSGGGCPGGTSTGAFGLCNVDCGAMGLSGAAPSCINNHSYSRGAGVPMVYPP
jgi:hypothetical protein